MKKQKSNVSIIKQPLAILSIGMVLLTYGFCRYIFITPNFGINLLTLQPTIIDGSISLLLGIGFVTGGIYSIIFRHRLVKEREKDLCKKKKDAFNQPKWLKYR